MLAVRPLTVAAVAVVVVATLKREQRHIIYRLIHELHLTRKHKTGTKPGRTSAF